MKFYFTLFLSFLYISSSFPLFSEEANDSQPQESQKEETQTKETSSSSTSSTTGSKEKNKDKDKKSGPILVYPELSEEFQVSYNESDPMGHVFTNFSYGLISGGIIGLGAGLSFYQSSTNLTPLYLTAAGVGGAGAIAGIVVAIIENSRKTPYVIGSPLFQYTWYGVISGALIGGLTGLIPYSSSNNFNDILNYIGYGTFGGLALGVALYFIIPQTTLKNIIIDVNPLESKLGYKFKF